MRTSSSPWLKPTRSMELPTHNDNSSHARAAIDLSHQTLKAFPSKVLRLHHLKTLRLDNNALEEVPWTSLMALKSLTRLNLSYNKLKELPVMLAEWHTIEVLDVSHNCIDALSKDLWTLFRQPQFIIPLLKCTGCPFTVSSSARLTKALIARYGTKLPPVLRLNQESPMNHRHLDVHIREPLDELPLITVEVFRYYNPYTVLVRPGKGYWDFDAVNQPRIRLEGNPVLEKIPDLEKNWDRLAKDWAADEKQKKASAEEESDSSSDEQDDVKLSKKEKRENTRPKRRQQREKSKSDGSARDDKRGV